jgi:hypothetical protein
VKTQPSGSSEQSGASRSSKPARLSHRRASAVKPASERALIAELLAGTGGLSTLASKQFEGERPAQSLAQWWRRTGNRRTLISLRELAEQVAELRVAEGRAQAAAVLVRMAASESDADVARKACVELLKVPSRVVAGEASAAAPERRAAVDEKLVRSVWHKLDQLDEQERSRVLAEFSAGPDEVDASFPSETDAEPQREGVV